MVKLNFLILFAFLTNFAFSQCESDATIEETQSWLKEKIEMWGGSPIPGTNYKVELTNCGMVIKEFLNETTDIANTYTIDYSALNIENSTSRTNALGTLKILLRGSVSLSNDIFPEYKGEIELSFTPTDADFFNRFMKALKHAKCLCPQSKTNTVKEKF